MVEVKGVNGAINAEPSSDNQVEVLALKHARRSDVNSVQIKVVEHAGGVTICAVYPTDYPSKPNSCEPGEGNGRNSVRNNDVSVEFTIRVPAQVALAARTINGEISANLYRETSLPKQLTVVSDCPPVVTLRPPL